MLISEINVGWRYRYVPSRTGSEVRVFSLAPGAPSQDDPGGPKSEDMVLVHYVGEGEEYDDCLWVYPKDLAPIDAS